jgi:hypothetical protein
MPTVVVCPPKLPRKRCQRKYWDEIYSESVEQIKRL